MVLDFRSEHLVESLAYDVLAAWSVPSQRPEIDASRIGAQDTAGAAPRC
jgi:hypothetical protein